MQSTGIQFSLPQQNTPSLTPLQRSILSICCLCFAMLCLILLFTFPAANESLKALCNRLFTESEAVNAYQYDHFAVATDQSLLPSILFLIGFSLSLAAAFCFLHLHIAALIAAVLLALAQSYLGLSLSPFLNLLCFGMLGFTLLHSRSKTNIAAYITGLLVLFTLFRFTCPGVNEHIESASEHVRDWLSPPVSTVSSSADEFPADALNETRHVNTQSLTGGDIEGQADQEYRIVTVQVEQISIPHWIDYIRIVLLLLLTVAAVILPFVPFVLLNQRRKQTLAVRSRFDCVGRNESICAMFLHIIHYLDATGYGCGNQLYCLWPVSLQGHMPESYIDSFRECCVLFEEAMYSGHTLSEEQQNRVIRLLNDTETLLFDHAGWKQRFKLRYVECLHE